MNMPYAEVLAHVVLWLAPLYVLLGLGALLLGLERRAPTPSYGLPRPSRSAPSVGALVRLAAPLWVLLYLATSTTRGSCGAYVLSQALLTQQTLNWLMLVQGGGGLVVGLVLGCFTTWRAPWAPELVCALATLLVTWSVAGVVTNLLSLVLLLELAGVGLFLLVTYTFLLGRSGAQAWDGVPASRLVAHGRLGLLGALLFFLWVSAFSALLLLWACARGAATLGGLDLAAMRLLCELAPRTAWGRPEVAGWAVLGVAILAKLLLLPLQAVLVGFYRQLPVVALLLYLGAYYLFFVALGLIVLAGHTSVAGGAWAWLTLWGVVGLVAAALAYVGPTLRVRSLLALSSVITLALLLLLAQAGGF